MNTVIDTFDFMKWNNKSDGPTVYYKITPF